MRRRTLITAALVSPIVASVGLSEPDAKIPYGVPLSSEFVERYLPECADGFRWLHGPNADLNDYHMVAKIGPSGETYIEARFKSHDPQGKGRLSPGEQVG